MNGKTYSVHKSIYESAKNFAKASSIPLTVISKALEVHSSYRLILCGHSYGGAVAALLALIWSDPQKPYVTNSTSGIPSNKSIHAYVYGAPSCMSYELSLHCKPLITNIINHNDIIPYFSHGFMTDQKQCCKLIFSYLNNEIPKKRKTFISGILSRAMNRQKKEDEEEESYEWIDEVLTRSFNTLGKRSDTKKQNDDKWFSDKYEKCKKLMTSEKIYPPGYLFIIEETSETYTNPNNINDKNHSHDKNNSENVLAPAVALDTDTNMFESDQDTITIHNIKNNESERIQSDNENNKEEYINTNDTHRPPIKKSKKEIETVLNESSYSFEKMDSSFNNLSKEMEKSFVIEKESDIFTSTEEIDMSNKELLINSDNSNSKLLFNHQIINISNRSNNQKSENINIENGQSEKITRIKLYECQVKYSFD